MPGVSGEQNSTTDSNGKVSFGVNPTATGNIAIKIENRTSSTVVPVTSWSLYVDVASQVNEGASFTVTVRNGTAAGSGLESAAVIFNGETKTTNTSGVATFTAPSVTANKDYPITATLVGHAEGTATVTVLNVPKLSIIAPSKATAGSTFEVTIANDVGSSVIGATITFDAKTYTSGAQGKATLTAPSETGAYTITATFTGFTAADPVTITIEAGGIPGFELLTLIAAIGVAFILLRRRRH